MLAVSCCYLDNFCCASLVGVSCPCLCFLSTCCLGVGAAWLGVLGCRGVCGLLSPGLCVPVLPPVSGASHTVALEVRHAARAPFVKFAPIHDFGPDGLVRVDAAVQVVVHMS